ncbi:uncharacterized protein [Haliotis cracherodii]|uniref:uncharacterized protein n=1 Tax=Haliotis cracherodii TaxID=6455 RepID=UPI0039E7A625
MWKMMTLSFLMCIFTAKLIRVQVAADAAADCAACTAAYTPGADCANLKTYLGCLETAAGTTEGCTLSTADAQIITDAKCTPALDPPCTCQKVFWGSDLTGNKECAALKTYIGCLKTDGTKPACAAGTTASELLTKPQGRSESKCTSDQKQMLSDNGIVPDDNGLHMNVEKRAVCCQRGQGKGSSLRGEAIQVVDPTPPGGTLLPTTGNSGCNDSLK